MTHAKAQRREEFILRTSGENLTQRHKDGGRSCCLALISQSEFLFKDIACGGKNRLEHHTPSLRLCVSYSLSRRRFGGIALRGLARDDQAGGDDQRGARERR
jgi:hypothetical protein